MKKARRALWVFAWFLVTAITFFGMLDSLRVGYQRPVGTDVVNVYTAQKGDGKIDVPVYDYTKDSKIETGNRVHVFLRTDYQQNTNLFPQLVLDVIGVTFFIQFCLWVFDQMRPRKSETD